MKLNAGWYTQINRKLQEYELETDFEKIRSKRRIEWKREVHAAAEKINLKRIQDECYETTPDGKKVKSKTSHALTKTSESSYQRKPMHPVTVLNQLETKALILARFRMLECGKNFRGKFSELCTECNLIDDETHRLNFCPRFKMTNQCESTEKFVYSDVFSDDVESVKTIIKAIMKVWNIKHGGMN